MQKTHGMKRSLTLAISALILLSATLLSCKVNNKSAEIPADSTVSRKSISRLLAGDVSKAWAIKSFHVDGEDQLKGLSPCELDNTDHYFRNLVYEAREGKSRCNDSDPDIRQRGKWSLNADSTAVEVKMGTSLFTLEIINLNENEFHYRSVNNGKTTEAVLVAVK